MSAVIKLLQENANVIPLPLNFIQLIKGLPMTSSNTWLEQSTEICN